MPERTIIYAKDGRSYPHQARTACKKHTDFDVRRHPERLPEMLRISAGLR